MSLNQFSGFDWRIALYEIGRHPMSPAGLLDSSRKGWAVLAFCLILPGLAATATARADDHDRGDDAAPRAGEVVPLEKLLARIHEDFNGRILEVEIEQEWRQGGRIWVYEAKLLTPRGHVLKLEYDAKSLQLLELKGRHGRHRRTSDDE